MPAPSFRTAVPRARWTMDSWAMWTGWTQRVFWRCPGQGSPLFFAPSRTTGKGRCSIRTPIRLPRRSPKGGDRTGVLLRETRGAFRPRGRYERHRPDRCRGFRASARRGDGLRRDAAQVGKCLRCPALRGEEGHHRIPGIRCFAAGPPHRNSPLNPQPLWTV